MHLALAACNATQLLLLLLLPRMTLDRICCYTHVVHSGSLNSAPHEKENPFVGTHMDSGGTHSTVNMRHALPSLSSSSSSQDKGRLPKNRAVSATGAKKLLMLFTGNSTTIRRRRRRRSLPRVAARHCNRIKCAGAGIRGPELNNATTSHRRRADRTK